MTPNRLRALRLLVAVVVAVPGVGPRALRAQQKPFEPTVGQAGKDVV